QPAPASLIDILLDLVRRLAYAPARIGRVLERQIPPDVEGTGVALEPFDGRSDAVGLVGRPTDHPIRCAGSAAGIDAKRERHMRRSWLGQSAPRVRRSPGAEPPGADADGDSGIRTGISPPPPARAAPPRRRDRRSNTLSHVIGGPYTSSGGGDQPPIFVL